MDLQHLRASDGTGEAVLAHIQTVRNPGSTVLDLDNVDNWNTKAVIITGTPAANGFVSPVGMKVMYGHLSAGDFIIDGYAPGYVDNGNTTTEVAIVKMTTNWADALISLLGNALADDGFLKVTSLDHFYKPVEISPNNFIASGGIVAQTAGLTGSFSNIVYYIAGLRYTKTGVANKAYIASKDTYVDIGTDGVVDYNDVANGAAAPALAANHIRVAKVVTSGAAITSIKQTGFDGLGNKIKPSQVLTTRQVLNPYCFRAIRNAAATSANSINAKLPVNVIDFDPNNNFDTANNRYTAPVSGIYDVKARFSVVSSSVVAFAMIYVNGVEVRRGSLSRANAEYNGLVFNDLIELNAGDYIEAWYFVGAALGFELGTKQMYFSGSLVTEL